MESLFFALVLTFLLTFFYMPSFILKIKSSGHLITDRYKPEKPELPTHGAVLVLFVMLFVCSITPVLFGVLRDIGITDDSALISEIDFAILFVILAYGLFGFIDELININDYYGQHKNTMLFLNLNLVTLVDLYYDYDMIHVIKFLKKYDEDNSEFYNDYID